ncbi:MAG: PCRF domain-containing protein, partial [Actinobacteria bacterium]|nr:PCRF domain-containing protein [Actinomycetota bacterium]
MIERLVDEIIERYEALSGQLADPAIFAEPGRFAEVSKAHADLQEAYDLAREFAAAQAALVDAETLMAEGGLDAEMKEYLSDEKAAARETMARLEDAI